MKKLFRSIKLRNLLFGIITLIILLIGWKVGINTLIDHIEIITYDWRAYIANDSGPFNTSFKKASNDIILLSADDYTNDLLEKQYPDIKIGRWPWPRKTWGNIVNFINRGKPKAIVFDIKFEGDEGTDIQNLTSDHYFAESIKKNNSVLAIALSQPRRLNQENIEKAEPILNNDQKLNNLIYYNVLNFKDQKFEKSSLIPKVDTSSFVKEPPDYLFHFFNQTTFYGYTSIYKELLENAKMVGVINLKSSENMIARDHVPLYRLIMGKYTYFIPSLPLATVLAVLPNSEKTPFKLEKNKIILGKRVIPIDEDAKFLINWHGQKLYQYVPIIKVLLTDALEKKKIKNIYNPGDLISPDVFKNKIVVIGQTSAGTDIHPTPMSMTYPGPEIITTCIDNLLNDTKINDSHARKFITKAPFWLNLTVLILFCLAIGIFNIKTRSNFLSLIWVSLMFFLFILVSSIVFIHPQIRIWINMSYPLIFMTLTAINTYLWKIYIGNQEKKVVENLFGKFVSPQVLDKLLNDPKSINKQGQRKIMSVLFSDIRDFTTLSESLTVHDFILQLNEYFTEMVELILKYNGTLDKFMGDAVMAFYGDPLNMKNHTLMAVLTAIDMQKTLAELNKKWTNEGKPALTVGIGINTGDMIVGHMGSPRLLDYTVIGDNVNLAQRIEDLNKEYNTKLHILVSEAVYLEVKDYVNAVFIDERTVKGRQSLVRLYSIEGLNSKGEEIVLSCTKVV